MRRVHRRKSCRCISRFTCGPAEYGAAPQIRASERNVFDVPTVISGVPYCSRFSATGAICSRTYLRRRFTCFGFGGCTSKNSRVRRPAPSGTLIAASGMAFVPIENSKEPPPISKSRMRPAPQPCQRRTAKYVIAASWSPEIPFRLTPACSRT